MQNRRFLKETGVQGMLSKREPPLQNGRVGTCALVIRFRDLGTNVHLMSTQGLMNQYNFQSLEI